MAGLTASTIVFEPVYQMFIESVDNLQLDQRLHLVQAESTGGCNGGASSPAVS